MADIVERLTATRFSGRFTMGGASISSDPAQSKTSWGGERIMELVNPDGQSAAAEITALRAERDGHLDIIETLTLALEIAREHVIGSKHEAEWRRDLAVIDAALARLVDRAAGP